MTKDPIEERFLATIAGKSEDEIKALALASPAVHFACFCTIKDKENRVIHPQPNVLQLRMSEAYETLRELGVRVRIICTKPRQVGCSSFASHIVYHFGQIEPIEGISISDNKKHSGEILDKIKDYGKTDSYPWGVTMIPSASHSAAWTNGTTWTIDTAENPDAGVGGTRQAGHFSEVSKWPKTAKRNDKTTMAAVLPSLSGMGTVVIAESTPEGALGWQYSTWQEAVTLAEFLKMYEAGIRPEEVWVKVFAAWYEFADNARANPVSEAEIAMIRRTLDDHEKKEIALYNLTWEQIAWRRDTIKSICNGDPKVFSYYYPSDDVSCWMASGAPRFDMAICCDMAIRAEMSTPDAGYLVRQDNDQVMFHRQRDGTGDIWVWETPREGLRYLVSIDPATDESQTIGADPDRHSVSVWRAGYHDTALDRWMPAKRVARVKPPYYADGDQVAGHVIRLSRYYGRATATIEINCGLDILRLILEANVSVVKRRPYSHRMGKVVEQYGFRMTDVQERDMVLEGFAAAIRERNIDPSCPHAVNEYKTFIITQSGRAEAASGCHDDDVLADAIAWECMPSASEYQRHKMKNVDPTDRGENGWRSVRKNW